jgi:hypothetical protein
MLSPTIRKRTSSKLFASRAAASRKYSIPLSLFSRENTATTGAVGGNPSPGRTGSVPAGSRNRETSIPFRITLMREGA